MHWVALEPGGHDCYLPVSHLGQALVLELHQMADPEPGARCHRRVVLSAAVRQVVPQPGAGLPVQVMELVQV